MHDITFVSTYMYYIVYSVSRGQEKSKSFGALKWEPKNAKII